MNGTNSDDVESAEGAERSYSSVGATGVSEDPPQGTAHTLRAIGDTPEAALDRHHAAPQACSDGRADVPFEGARGARSGFGPSHQLRSPCCHRGDVEDSPRSSATEGSEPSSQNSLSCICCLHDFEST